MPRESQGQEHGWSLTELLTVLAIMGIMAATGGAELSGIGRKGAGT